jgi:hypothetical protein
METALEKQGKLVAASMRMESEKALPVGALREKRKKV